MSKHETRLRELIRERTYSASAATQHEADLAAVIAAARDSALEEAACAAFSSACETCGKLCRREPTGGEDRTGAWVHAEWDGHAYHTAKPLGAVGAVDRIRALKSKPAGECTCGAPDGDPKRLQAAHYSECPHAKPGAGACVWCGAKPGEPHLPCDPYSKVPSGGES